MHFLDISNSVSLCTGLKANGPVVTTLGKVYVYYLVFNSARTSLTTRNYSLLGMNNFRCIGVYHDASSFYALTKISSTIKLYSFPLTGGSITIKDLT